ncbi:MAG: heavy-metal-associated domain-containing protein [Bacillota bacterium]
METVVLNVEGMTCSHCEMSVVKELKKLRGVATAAASASAGTATVTYDPSLATMKDFEAAVSEAGYTLVGTDAAAQPAQDHQHDGHAMGHGGHGHGGHGCCH